MSKPRTPPVRSRVVRPPGRRAVTSRFSAGDFLLLLDADNLQALIDCGPHRLSDRAVRAGVARSELPRRRAGGDVPAAKHGRIVRPKSRRRDNAPSGRLMGRKRPRIGNRDLCLHPFPVDLDHECADRRISADAFHAESNV
jgi:hypothetical protein